MLKQLSDENALVLLPELCDLGGSGDSSSLLRSVSAPGRGAVEGFVQG